MKNKLPAVAAQNIDYFSDPTMRIAVLHLLAVKLGW